MALLESVIKLGKLNAELAGDGFAAMEKIVSERFGVVFERAALLLSQGHGLNPSNIACIVRDLSRTPCPSRVGQTVGRTGWPRLNGVNCSVRLPEQGITSHFSLPPLRQG